MAKIADVIGMDVVKYALTEVSNLLHLLNGDDQVADRVIRAYQRERLDVIHGLMKDHTVFPTFQDAASYWKYLAQQELSKSAHCDWVRRRVIKWVNGPHKDEDRS